MNLLFVYGSLREGARNHAQLRQSTLIAKNAKIKGELRFATPTFPGLLLEGDDFVVGEVYEVTDTVLRSIDAFEDFENTDSDLYKRVTVQVYLENNETLQSFVYAYADADGLRQQLRVLSGDWLNCD